jgi:DNA-binding MarR family transcriptional regulator
MPNTRDPKRSLGFLLTETARLIRRNFDRRVQPLGLTQTQWRAIAHLKHNEGIKQATLAEILEVQPITLARLIDRMERDGWVERRPDPNDRRAVQLFLTDKVEPVVAQM